MIEHIKNWNRWRKSNLNSNFHKILVLIKLIKSPTFCFYNLTTCDNKKGGEK